MHPCKLLPTLDNVINAQLSLPRNNCCHDEQPPRGYIRDGEVQRGLFLGGEEVQFLWWTFMGWKKFGGAFDMENY